MKNQNISAAQVVGQCFETQGCNNADLSKYVEEAVGSARIYFCVNKNCKRQLDACSEDSKCVAITAECNKICEKEIDASQCLASCTKNNTNAAVALYCTKKSECL